MKSAIVKRSVVIAGHKTSVSLEDPFWKALKEIAALNRVRLCDLVAFVDAQREHANLSSAIRMFVLAELRGQLGEKAVAAGLAQEHAQPASSAA
jgi:predicted DNA-binding ribbon-helix-helix protein